MKRLVVVGAGPIGLAAALGAQQRGWEVSLLEQGEIGDALRRWGPTRLFSPLGMNVPASVRSLLGARLPDEAALLTGPQLVEQVLAPLAASAPLAGRVHTRHRVVAIGRARMSRDELPGHPLRAERPFRLLVETADGERYFEAERVLDASGVYGRSVAGAGGLPALGERAASARIAADLGQLHERFGSPDRLDGRRLLLVGHGHSAANAIGWLDEVITRHRITAHVTWAVRSAQRRPCVEVADDPLPERQAIVARANHLAATPPRHLTVERRAAVEAIESSPEGLAVALTGGRRVSVDGVVALTGGRPDHSLTRELALEVSPVTEGAARLTRAIAKVTDCLSVPTLRPEDLQSGEPGFFLVGAKAYGRARTFLLQTGYQQLETVLGLL